MERKELAAAVLSTILHRLPRPAANGSISSASHSRGLDIYGLAANPPHRESVEQTAAMASWQLGITRRCPKTLGSTIHPLNAYAYVRATHSRKGEQSIPRSKVGFLYSIERSSLTV